MKKILKTIVNEYGWIHLTIGIMGNFLFVVGSVLFLPRFEAYQTAGVWLFIFGSFFMLIGSLGSFFVSIWENEKDRN